MRPYLLQILVEIYDRSELSPHAFESQTGGRDRSFVSLLRKGKAWKQLVKVDETVADYARIRGVPPSAIWREVADRMAENEAKGTETKRVRARRAVRKPRK